ncbi:MAG: ABC transporter substrate-binding protein [Nitrospirota bacterium]|nr:MAG: ABC transporter substrate-binding protein [Nitrospirota bacterium]
MKIRSIKYKISGLVLTCLLGICFSLIHANVSVAAEKVIGVVMTGKIPYYEAIHKAFVDEMNKSGLLTSENLQVVVQKPAPEAMSWTNAIRKLVAYDASVIVTYGAPVTLTALNETKKIPIVFAGVYDPDSVKIPNNKATGISSKVPISTVLKNLKSMSGFSKLGVVYNDAEKDTIAQADEIKKLQEKFGFESVLFNIKRTGDESKIKDVDAVYMTTSCAAMYCVNNIVGVARRAKMPTATTIGGGEDIGVLLTIAADPDEQGSKAAQIVGKVIKGSSTASIPFESPKKVYMVVNLKEAKAIDVKVPFSILTSATKVIK